MITRWGLSQFESSDPRFLTPAILPGTDGGSLWSAGRSGFFCESKFPRRRLVPVTAARSLSGFGV